MSIMQSLLPVLAFFGLLAVLPFALRWWQRRLPGGGRGEGLQTRVVSALALGPQQRVVTVEVGPPGGRTWLVLGVTAQNIQCLHTMEAAPASPVSGDALPGPIRFVREEGV